MNTLRGMPRTFWIGACALALWMIGAAGVSIAQLPAAKTDAAAALQEPSSRHLFGTDDLGRDILVRVLHGGKISLLVALGAVALSSVLGTLLGMVAGYLGSVVDQVIMRVMDLLLAFPGFLLAIAIVGALGPGLRNAILAVAIVYIPFYARLARACSLELRERAFVRALTTMGASRPYVLLRGLLPNLTGPILVQGTLNLGSVILDTAGLSFLGLGAQPPTPEWGAMLNAARSTMLVAPWTMVFPGVAIFTTVVGLNLMGEGLRDRLHAENSH